MFLKKFFIFFSFFFSTAVFAQEKASNTPEAAVKLSLASRHPNELLRLAYLREQKESFAQALFYLNLYALATHDTGTLPVIEQLAARYRLQGYEHDDLAWLMMKYNQYFAYLLLMVVLVWGAILGYWLYVWARGGKILTRYKLVWLVTLFGWGVLLNFYHEKQQGIIAQDEVYLMDAPSAGSRLVKVIGQGHRIDILDEADIWYKTRWQGKIAYIRKNCVWRLAL